MKQMKRLLTGILVLCMAVCVCACDGESGTSGQNETKDTEAVTTVQTEKETEAEKQAAFAVKVVDGNGNPVSGVLLQVCKDTCVPGRTGDDGVATFNIEITDGHKLQVLSCPTGYEYTGETEVYLDSGITEFTLELSEVQ